MSAILIMIIVLVSVGVGFSAGHAYRKDITKAWENKVRELLEEV